MHKLTVLAPRFVVLIVIILVFSGSYVVKLMTINNEDKPLYRDAESSFKRIVSLAPSITEILFALGLEDRVVGVTRHCKYPPKAQEKERVGGYYDLNYEAIYTLKPDLVIMLEDRFEQKEYVEKLGLNVLGVGKDSIHDILNAIRTIGCACNVEKRAEKVVSDIRARMDRAQEYTQGLSRPSVLVAIAHSVESGYLKDVYVAGRNSFYHELVELAGGDNVYHTTSVVTPTLSIESIAALNPDIIIDMVPDLSKMGLDENKIVKEWKSVLGIASLKGLKVYVFGGDFVAIPGPRLVLILEDMVRAIHPEIKLDLSG